MKPARLFYGLALSCFGLLSFITPAMAADRPGPPSVLVLALDPCAAEQGADPATFLVVRSGPANTPLTVQYAMGGTAENGVDYNALPGVVTIPSGAWFAPVTVNPIDDQLVEGCESVVIALQQPPLWPPPYIVAWPSVAFAEILDNDLAPTNRPPQVALIRPPQGAIFEAGTDIPLVACAFDLDGRVTTVEFFAGSTSLGIVTNRPILAPSPGAFGPSDDPVFELDRDLFPDANVGVTTGPVPSPGRLFRLVWSDAPVGPHVLTAVATDNDGAMTRSLPVQITVVDCPPPPIVTIRATDPVATEPSPASNVLDTATFVVHRTGPTNSPLTVYFRIGGSAINGVDYVELPQVVEIPAGQREAKLVVKPLDDLLVEGTETVVLELLPPLCLDVFPPPPDCYRLGLAHTAWAIIRDNDWPPNRPPVVRLVKPEDGAVFLAPADICLIAMARDFDGYVDTVEFFAGTNSLGIVTNRPTTDPVGTPDFSLVWSNVPPGHYVLTAVATDNDGAFTQSCPVEIRVVPQVLPPVVNLLTLDREAAETPASGIPNPAVFSVTRTGPTRWPLVVFYSISGTASNGVDYRELSGRVLIPAGASSNSIVIEPFDDNLVEGTETVRLHLEPPPIISPGPATPEWWYRIGSNSCGCAVILDNDLNQLPKAAIVHPGEGTVFPAYSDIEIDVVACDPDGYVTKMQFFEGQNLIGEQEMLFIIPPPPGQVQKFWMVWSNVPPGDYVLTAKAIDNLGASALSEPVRIRVRLLPPLPVVTIRAVDPVATEPNPLLPVQPDTALFKVFRTGDFSRELTVFYRTCGTAENGVDYGALPGRVTIPANAAAASIEVVPLDDTLVEGTESVILSLVQPPCVTSNTVSTDCYLVGWPGRDIAYILDNDAPPNRPPTVAIVSPPNGAVFSAPVDLRLVAAAGDSDGWVTTVAFFDGTNSLGVVSNRAWVVDTALVRLPGLGTDVLADCGCVMPFTLVWKNVPPGSHVLTAIATDNAGDSTRSRPITVTVLDSSHLPVVNLMTVDAVAREGTTNTAAFRIRRTGSTDKPLTVFYAIRGSACNGVDYVEIPDSVTIPAGRHSAYIIIQPIDDRLREGIETVVLRLRPPPVDPATYAIGRPAAAAAIILDNDRLLLDAETVAGGNLHLRLPLPLGMPFRLEASTDLENWEPVLDGIAAETGVSFVDEELMDRTQRFFRVVQEFGELPQE